MKRHEKLYTIKISNNYCYDMAELVSYFKEYNSVCEGIEMKDRDYEFIEKNIDGQIILKAYLSNPKKHEVVLKNHIAEFFEGLQSPVIQYLLS